MQGNFVGKHRGMGQGLCVKLQGLLIKSGSILVVGCFSKIHTSYSTCDSETKMSIANREFAAKNPDFLSIYYCGRMFKRVFCAAVSNYRGARQHGKCLST
eukprot:TRINITY_DN37769_c0_g1_i1.p1 TRINITY_DN37769_c0_g1~~TRINITY_DN37769_c0_g1_i1.p1  ORF type:complete len:100 (+),score=4.42 TRINITY_DN37769_c0_g1_i1:58-357(+)